MSVCLSHLMSLPSGCSKVYVCMHARTYVRMYDQCEQITRKTYFLTAARWLFVLTLLGQNRSPVSSLN